MATEGSVGRGYPLCCRVGCALDAYWLPILLLRADLTSPPGRAHVNLSVCTIHKEAVSIADVLNDKGWEQLIGAFKVVHKAEPIRAYTTIEWRTIHQGEDIDRYFAKRM